MDRLEPIRIIVIVMFFVSLLVGLVTFPLAVYRIFSVITEPTFQAGVVLLVLSLISTFVSLIYYILLKRLDTIELEIYRDRVEEEINDIKKQIEDKSTLYELEINRIKEKLEELEKRDL